MAERIIEAKNTSVPQNMFTDATKKDVLNKARGIAAAINPGKVDPQGDNMFKDPNLGAVVTPTPQFGYVATPSPAPGVNESPLMTWGEIEGTPFCLDGSDTPVVKGGGPSFKIPEIPVRDEIALNLAERMRSHHRKRKEKAVQHVNTAFKTPKFGGAKSIDRLQTMSPAARRLATSKLGIRIGTDKALKASYTPKSRPSTSTPIFKQKTPSVRSRGEPTPFRTPKLPEAGESSKSLTDNLLAITPRSRKNDGDKATPVEAGTNSTGRNRAADFF